MSELTRFDTWINNGGPAAVVLHELLQPVEGPDGVFFPSTYAPAEDRSKFAGGYNIDEFPDGSNVCQIDSVGSQANRIEPIFAGEEYAGLVPQVNIKAGDKTVRLLDAGHRAGDAVVRCSELKGELRAAFKEVLRGNAEPLAKIAPTSLVFGVWDSRDTEAKLPRLVSSTIRAFNVKPLRRSANYLVQQQLDYTKEGLIPTWESEKEKELYSKRGFLNALASASHGGVQLMDGDKLRGSIRRDATLGLAALRRLAVLEGAGGLSTDRTLALRRYILGLALVAITAQQDPYLRQGCNLVPADEGRSRTCGIVHVTGRREPLQLPHEEALSFARAAAAAFGVGKDRDVQFDRGLAEKDIKGDEEALKGDVTSFDADARTFKLQVGKAKNKKEVEVATNDNTSFLKGNEPAAFEQVVQKGAKLDVELTAGVAVKVSGKK